MLSSSSHLALFLVYSLFVSMSPSGTSLQVRPDLCPATIFRSPFPSLPIFLELTSDVLSLLSPLALFFRRLAFHLHSFEWQLAKSPAGSALSYHFPFYNSIFADLSTHKFSHSFIVFASRFFSRRLSLPLRHPFVVHSIGT